MNHDYKYDNMSEEDRNALVPATKASAPETRNERYSFARGIDALGDVASRGGAFDVNDNLGPSIVEKPTQPQHSPLPWSEDPEGEYELAIEAADESVVCSATHANARLIVASVNNAAKLAEELRSVLKYGSAGNENLIRAVLAAWEAAQ
jgi:hypothetical protein